MTVESVIHVCEWLFGVIVDPFWVCMFSLLQTPSVIVTMNYYNARETTLDKSMKIICSSITSN